MFAINSVGEIAAIEERGGVALVLLASPLETTALQWLARAWMTIHGESGCRWHLVVPTRRRTGADGGMALLSDYDGELAGDLLRIYGLKPSDMPCLVIDNFKDEERQAFVRLPDSDVGRDKLLIEISEYLKAAWAPRHPAHGESRSRLGQDLHRRLFWRQRRRQFAKALPVVGSALAKKLAGQMG